MPAPGTIAADGYQRGQIIAMAYVVGGAVFTPQGTSQTFASVTGLPVGRSVLVEWGGIVNRLASASICDWFRLALTDVASSSYLGGHDSALLVATSSPSSNQFVVPGYRRTVLIQSCPADLRITGDCHGSGARPLRLDNAFIIVRQN